MPPFKCLDTHAIIQLLCSLGNEAAAATLDALPQPIAMLDVEAPRMATSRTESNLKRRGAWEWFVAGEMVRPCPRLDYDSRRETKLQD